MIRTDREDSGVALGPIEVVVIAFPQSRLTGQVRPRDRLLTLTFLGGEVADDAQVSFIPSDGK